MVQPEDSFWVFKGEADLGGFTIHDSHPETGWFTFHRATAHSSNVCYAQIGTRVGAETALSLRAPLRLRAAHSGEPAGEAPGQIRPPSRWSARSLATISIGQEILVTPLQLVMAYAAVANGGTLLRPRLASALVNEDGKVVRQFPAERVRRVISEETARTFRSFLREAVTAGTAEAAALPWCDVGEDRHGAEIRREGGRVPLRPLHLLVHRHGAGGRSSRRRHRDPGRASGRLLRRLGRRAGLARDRGGVGGAGARSDLAPATVLPTQAPAVERANDPVPDVRLLEADRAAEVLRWAGYEPRVLGGRGRVAAQLPEAGVAAQAGAVVELMLAPESPAEAVVPDVRGLPIRDAVARLSALAIPVGRVVGSGSVVNQNPEPGRPRALQYAVLPHAGPSGDVIASGVREAAAVPRIVGALEMRGAPAGEWARVQYDSRAVEGGDLFVAIPGEKADGHAFVPEAARRGSIAAVVERFTPDASWPEVREERAPRARHPGRRGDRSPLA